MIHSILFSVESSDVIDESSPPFSHLSLDLFNHNLTETKETGLYQAASSPKTVFLFSPPSVFAIPEYRQFCNRLGHPNEDKATYLIPV